MKSLNFVADKYQNKIVRVLISAGTDAKSREAESYKLLCIHITT